MANSGGGGRGLFGTLVGLVVLAAILYGIYYAFGGDPEAFGAAIVNFGEGVWNFIARAVRAAIDAGRS